MMHAVSQGSARPYIRVDYVDDDAYLVSKGLPRQDFDSAFRLMFGTVGLLGLASTGEVVGLDGYAPLREALSPSRKVTVEDVPSPPEVAGVVLQSTRGEAAWEPSECLSSGKNWTARPASDPWTVAWGWPGFAVSAERLVSPFPQLGLALTQFGEVSGIVLTVSSDQLPRLSCASSRRCRSIKAWLGPTTK